MTDIRNLEAWAKEQGYDEYYDYTQPETLPPGYVSKHFREAEFTCNHCGRLHQDGVNMKLVDILEGLRAFYNTPVVINSGYRCPTHNSNVGGATHSQHMLGTAADVVVKGVDPVDVYAHLDLSHEGGLGRYNTFTHIDVRDGRARWNG